MRTAITQPKQYQVLSRIRHPVDHLSTQAQGQGGQSDIHRGEACVPLRGAMTWDEPGDALLAELRPDVFPGTGPIDETDIHHIGQVNDLTVLSGLQCEAVSIQGVYADIPKVPDDRYNQSDETAA